MFLDFFLFELRYFLRGWMVWIFLLIIAAMLFGAASSDNVTVGGGIGSTNRNAPWVVENFYAVTSILTLVMTTAFVNNAATRDFTYNTHQMIFSLPVKKSGFLLGRFAGATLIGIIPTLGTSIGILLARYAPWADQDRFGPDLWRAHWDGLIGFAIPNAIFMGAILFGIALLFRSTIVSFLSALLSLVLVGVANSMMSDMKNETAAALLDPFGTRAFGFVTKYWTVAERNAHSLPLSGVFLWNRLIWLAVGLGIFAMIAGRVTLGERASRKEEAARGTGGGEAGSACTGVEEGLVERFSQHRAIPRLSPLRDEGPPEVAGIHRCFSGRAAELRRFPSP
jgi:ABC-2 type transport system permease protein